MPEAGEAHLHGAHAVETQLGREVDVQALGERGEALGTLRAVEERRRAGDHHVQPREPALIDLVDDLA